MKTFTHCAEKKANKFFNLLQNYTKSIRITAMLMLLLVGTGNAWGAVVTPTGKYFYFKTSDTWDVDGARYAVCFQYKNGGGQDDWWYSCIKVPGEDDIYYAVAPAEYWDMYFCRMNGSNTTNSWDNNNRWNQTNKLQYDGTNNYWEKKTGWNADVTYSTYAPPLSAITAYDNGTDWISGSGTANDPFLIYEGTTIKVKAVAEKVVDDPDAEILYSFICKQGNLSPTQTNDVDETNEYTANTADCLYAIHLEGYTKVGSTKSATSTSPTLYYKTVLKPDNRTVYLKPNSAWKEDGARFAAYFFGDNNVEKWVDMTAVGCDNEYYTCTVPLGYDKVIFCRMNGETTENNWDNKWNQTGNLIVPTGENNVYDMTIPFIFLTPNGNWTSDGARFAAYFFGNGETWVSMVDTNADGIYECEIPSGYPSVILCRMNPTTTANNWNNRWNQTSDLTIPTDGKNHYTVKDKTWDKGGGTWSTRWDDCYWTSTNDALCTVHFNSNLPVDMTVNRPVAPKYIHTCEVIEEPQMNHGDGYIFGGWYKDEACTSKFDFLTEVTGDMTLYAKWVPESECVFFKNNLGWGEVWVYTFSGDVWDAWQGVIVRNSRIEYGKMTQLNQSSDIYFYVLDLTKDYPNRVQENNSSKSYIAFSKMDQSGNYAFYKNEAIYRGDFKEKLTLFIPQPKELQGVQEWNNTQYYSKGLWMKYNSTESGYQVPGTIPNDDPEHTEWETWGNKFTTDNPGGYTFNITKTLEANKEYYFKIRNYTWVKDWENKDNNQWFGYDEGTITESNCTDLHYVYEESHDTQKDNTTIKTAEAGDYVFSIYLGDGRVTLSVKYPIKAGSYRLAYKDDVQTTEKYSYRILPSTTECLDTASFFVRHDKSPQIRIDKYSNSTWTTHEGWTSVTDNVTKTGVHNFVIKQTSSGNTATLQADKTHEYTGDYYVRTQVADGGWDNFRQSSHRMTYSSYADKYENFDHHFCRWVNDANADVRFTVANDYSDDIADILVKDPDDATQIATDEGHLPNASASVRFGWDSQTNELSRAYLSGSSHVADRFLVLIGDANLKDTEGNNFNISGLNAHETNFADKQNWIYQVDVLANKFTAIKLVAKYAGVEQYFKGSASETESLLTADATKSYPIRIIYDFKTNHLVAAWTMEGNQEITGDDVLGADMMIIRTDHNQAEQLTFNPNSKILSSVGHAYAVMSFTKNFIQDDSKSIYERGLYWISFPFDVQLSDAFGFGEYGDKWIMQRYRGDLRAEKGLFSDSGTYWEYMTNTKDMLKAGVGYVLALDLDKVKNSFVHDVEQVGLYFPSTGSLSTITGELPTEVEVPAHQCEIVREDDTGVGNRKIYDSHWNMIGVPGFADISDFNVTQYKFSQSDASFYYKYLPGTNIYSVESSTATTFQSMYAYMVQFAGTINWSKKAVSNTPQSQLAARRNAASTLPEKVSLRLEIAQDEVMADQTFVQLQQEGATPEFDMNLDLTKIINSGANIYTLAGEQRIQSAGNALPMEEVIVPVGVKIDAEGEYTFRMPDGTEGMVVELIDYESNTTTNLLLSDYTVTLPAGSNESRFALHIQPNKSGVTTGVENVGDEAKGVEKYLIDGKLIIRTAEGVFDAQGKRL